MKPRVHSKNSVKRYVRVEEDYIHIHNWFDSTKAATADFYHRAILHNSFGIFLAEQLFGVTLTKWFPRESFKPHYESLETLEKQLS